MPANFENLGPDCKRIWTYNKKEIKKGLFLWEEVVHYREIHIIAKIFFSDYFLALPEIVILFCVDLSDAVNVPPTT